MTESTPRTVPIGDAGRGKRIGICAGNWHRELVDELCKGAVATLVEHGVASEDIISIDCPGSYELPVAALHLIRRAKVDAVLAFGVVVRGETAHFEYVASPVAHGLMDVSLNTGVPCMFGVLTTENMEQARERCGGLHGHKGREAALGALQLLASIEAVAPSSKS
ncbi:MAG: 6,7-dimethyl-8-ribityllumazine synthase [Candidatus Kapabacteria bacterium]|nr:6,7-dimethyl-8-ribityllumazine synthase [Candidatus Kapabacteria bacterium]